MLEVEDGVREETGRIELGGMGNESVGKVRAFKGRALPAADDFLVRAETGQDLLLLDEGSCDSFSMKLSRSLSVSGSGDN